MAEFHARGETGSTRRNDDQERYIMPDAFGQLIDTAIEFFTELDQNNRKDWFEENKTRYTNDIKRPAEHLRDIIGDEITRLTDEQMRGKLFRIHRDVRFSKDKTPYNAHLHLMWSPATEGAPLWFFGAAPSYLFVGLGLMGLKGESLDRYRAMVDQHGTALTDALSKARLAVRAEMSHWGPEPLKRVPKPYPADHPLADLLRLKALTLNADLAPDWRAQGLVPSVMDRVRGMLPVWDILDSHFG